MHKTLSVLLLFSGTALAQTTGTGQYPISEKFPEAQACLIAENLAVEHAIRTKNGVVLDATQIFNCKDTDKRVDCNFEKNYELSTRGSASKIFKRTFTVTDNVCQVDVVLNVEKSKFIPINIFGSDMYRAGEYLNYQVSVPEPMYLYVVSVNRNVAHVLFPYDDFGRKPIQHNFTIPHVFRTSLPKGTKFSQEQLIFLFSEYKISLRLDQRMGYDQLQEVIKSIPVDARKVFYRNIVIKDYFN